MSSDDEKVTASAARGATESAQAVTDCPFKGLIPSLFRGVANLIDSGLCIKHL